jgi:hypothetical protein
MQAIFTNWSMKTPNDNVLEIYINHHIKGKSFRIVVKDDTLVDLSFYKSDAEVIKINLENRTIYEGENNDVNYPHLYINR